MIKCVVWDLDNTIWDGILAEDPDTPLKSEIGALISDFDSLGILQSVASRNDAVAARGKLLDLGLWSFFLHPQIGWQQKSVSVGSIITTLGLNPASVVFVDDDDYDRGEVSLVHEGIRAVHPSSLSSILETIQTEVGTESSVLANRRLLYAEDLRRQAEEAAFQGNREQFHQSLGLEYTIARPLAGDLDRAVELTRRTHQLNTTGITVSKSELVAMLSSENEAIFIGSLRDRFGSYGIVSLALLSDVRTNAPTIKLLLTSCRVLNRGVAHVLLIRMMRFAHDAGKRLCADFVENGRNRAMMITYRFLGFKVTYSRGPYRRLKWDSSTEVGYPKHVVVKDVT
jgi:FkbH-like protein